MQPDSQSRFWARAILLVTFVLSVGACVQFGRVGLAIGAIPASIKWTTAFGLGLFAALFSAGLLALTATRFFPNIQHALETLGRLLSRNQTASLILYVLLLGVLPFFVMGPYGRFMKGFMVRLAILWGVGLLGAALLSRSMPKKSWPFRLAFSLLMQGAVYQAALYIPQVSNYPFGLHYSESNTIYYASQMYGWRVYSGQHLGLPIDNPSRYLLMGMPFLFPRLPLWFHRLWQALLWVGMTYAVSTALVRRLGINDRSTRILWTAWGFLFIFQGPIYYHLLFAALIVLWGLNTRRFWKSMAVVIVASVWAGISRINWMPVPAMMAASLYLLERRYPAAGPIWRYLRPPFYWAIGGGLASLGSLALYSQFSGAEGRLFLSSVGSPLLWYRLLPSATYRTGVLIAILAASVGLTGIILLNFTRRQHWIHPLRSVFLGLILLVLFVSGLIVSVKIGGGNNIHNFDAFLVHLMLVGSYVVFAAFAPDESDPAWTGGVPWALMVLTLSIPILFAVGQGGPLPTRDMQAAERALLRLQQVVDEVVDEGDRVLFIDHRHLIPFGFIDGVNVEPEYDKVLLMEMAMSDNDAYFKQFEADISAARYDVIVASPLHLTYKDRDDIFPEEDNAWTSHVTVSLIKYYKTSETIELDRGNLGILVPKE
jgi:hypothetical protein